MSIKLHKFLFYFFVATLPINLGKHFIGVDSYVRSRLIDYLIPTIWFQDIVLVLLLVVWLGTSLKEATFVKKIKSFPYWRFLFIFLLAFLPSVLISPRLEISLFSFLIFSLRTLLVLYVFCEVSLKKEFKTLLYIFLVQILVLAFIGIGQWVKQASLFNNYLILGEQVYNNDTFNISKVPIEGVLKIPPYGTFRHPNILGGYLSIIIFWLFFYLTFSKPVFNKALFYIVFAIGFVLLCLTFSQLALISFISGISFYFLILKFGRKGVLASISATFLFLAFSLLINLYSTLVPSLKIEPSIYRRANLLNSALSMISENPYWGVGFNSFTVALQNYLPLTQVLSFNQPVHNVPLLIFAESGIFALILLAILSLYSFWALLQQRFGLPALLFINLLQMVILSSFDHYFYTIHQTQLLYLLTLGLTLTYTNFDE